MSGPLFFVYPSQFLDFKEVSTPETGICKLFSRIEIENLAQHRIAYRIRTNAKDCYSVQHNPGMVEKDQRGEVLVYLRPGKTVSVQHRFMVTAAECADESIGRHDFWKHPQKGRLAHWRLSVRPPLMDPETTMSMYQQQVQSLKVENQMLRNKCDQLVKKVMEVENERDRNGQGVKNDLDRSTVLCLAVTAVFLTQMFIYIWDYSLS